MFIATVRQHREVDVNSIKIGTVLGLHAIIKREVKVTSVVLLTLCDIQRAANNIKCTVTNISRAIEKCKKLRGSIFSMKLLNYHPVL